MSGKIDKIIARLQSRIEEGQFYEAQQQTRVVAARYIKSESWDPAINILFNAAQSLLKAGQGGSGSDLCLFLVDVYKQAGLKPDSANKGKLLTLLRLFDGEEPTRKKFVGEMIAWSSKCGEYAAGDPELHHVAGSLYAEEHDAYDAERHLVLGTKDSAEVLASLEYQWYQEDDSHTAALYAARAVFPYLLMGNVRDASKVLRLFTSKLSELNKNLAVQQVSSNASAVSIYPSLPLLNFLSLLMLAVTKGSADLFRQLTRQYAAYLKDVEGAWDESLEGVAEMYFAISRPRQGNPLMDMMGSMFGTPPAQKKPAPRRIGATPQAPPSEGLD